MAFSLRKRQRVPTVPIESFSDIAFLLIIFFILATSIRRMTGFTTELPAGEKSKTAASDKTPTVQMHGGRMNFDDQPISMGELELRLDDLKLADKADEKRVVLLDATEDVAYQDYFEVMSLITSAGGVVGILTDEEEE